jgi:PKD repeat protein
MTFALSSYSQISGISIDPGNVSRITVTSNQGLYYSTNGGASFAHKVSGNFSDLVRHPTNNSIIYASRTNSGTIYRSVDGGNTWSVSMNGISSVGSKLLIAVTKAAPNKVYAMSVGGNLGFWVSNDSGNYYDLKTRTIDVRDIVQIGFNDCLAVSSLNENLIVFGAVHLGRSTDGGYTWTQISEWDDPHCDHHWLHFDDNGYLYNGNDGGMWRSTDNGYTWARCNANFTAEQYYRMGQSTGSSDIVLAGSQDNGFHYISGGTWKQGNGGDAMESIVDYSNNNIMVGLGFCGSLLRSNNGGAVWAGIQSGSSGIPFGSGAWVTPIVIDPVNPNVYFMGFRDVWKSTDGCYNWTKITNNLTGGSNITQMTIDPSNNNIMYACCNERVYKSTDGGYSWTGNIAGGTNSYEFITCIRVSPTNSNEVWITKSGFASGKKVYRSTNGGSTWENMSLNLPNLPFNSIAIEGNTANGIYIGSDQGVFYKDNTMSSWIDFDSNLPNVIVNELEIYYPTQKIRACTYGRGVWESDLYNASAIGPVANFVSSITTICEGVVVFTDASENQVDTWSWDFGDGNTSNQQNPTHTYTNPGTYTVQLTVQNGVGSDTYTGTVNVVLASDPVVYSNSGCEGESLTLTASGDGTLFWYDAQSGGTLLHTGSSYTTPALNNTTSFYVENSEGGGNYNVGPSDNSFGNGDNHSGPYGLIFDVFSNMVLESVKVYATGAADRTINVYDAEGGNLLHTTTVNIPDGESRVDLNFDLTPGTGYFINSTSTAVDLFRNSDGPSYPYVVNNVVSINRATAPDVEYDYYYYFYDWQVTVQGCASNRIEAQATIYANPVPTISLQGNELVTEAGFVTYQWYVDGNSIQGANSNTHMPLVEGDYTVEVTDNNDCSNLSDPFEFVLTNIETNQATGQLVIFPNPNNGEFTVKLLTSQKDIMVKIMNMQGQLVYLKEFINTSNSLDCMINIPMIKSGVYHINILAGDKVFNQELIIK